MAQQFTRNYTDHSNDSGFQFEFHCDKCGNGYRSTFKSNKLGMAAGFLKAAGSLFGGALSQAGYGADHVKDVLRGPAWDSAFNDAIDEIKPRFRQCSRCGQWVCPEVCWNEKRQLCEGCAPDLAEQAAHIQQQVAVEQMWEKARSADQMQGMDMSQAQVASCPSCQARLEPNARFCASCGQAVKPAANAFCAQCGQQLRAGARFCAGCGTPSAR